MRWREVLVESVKKYLPMFAMFKNADGDVPEWASARIRSVESTLKREDRVVWALRWERYIAFKRGANSQRIENRDQIERKLLNDLGSPEQDWLDTYLARYEEMIRDYFAHWFSLPIPAIQNFTFNRQTPDDIWDAFTMMEEEWKKTRQQIINHAESYPPVEDDEDDIDPYEDSDERRAREIEIKQDIEKMIDFGDGWAWWNLNRTYCKREGDAMGHCGNAPSAKPGDTVLSLRKDMGDGKFRPSLTFILHDTGYLGEMKGRANEKPKEKYFPYIIALLKNPRIKGCDGGGYASGNNFSVLDLPEETRNELLEYNPNLMSMSDRLRIFKESPSDENKAELIRRVSQDLRSYGFIFKRFDFDSMPRPLIIIEDYGTREDFNRRSYNYFPLIEQLEDFFGGLEDSIAERFNDDDAEVIATKAHGEFFNSVFDVLLDYSHDDFILDGVQYQVVGPKNDQVVLCIPIQDYISPSSYQMPDDDPTPVLEYIHGLDQTGYERDISWSDVEHQVKRQLSSETEIAIAKCAITENHFDYKTAVEMVYGYFDGDGADFHYYSHHPDQLSLDLPEPERK